MSLDDVRVAYEASTELGALYKEYLKLEREILKNLGRVESIIIQLEEHTDYNTTRSIAELAKINKMKAIISAKR